MSDFHKAIRTIHNNVVSINGDTQDNIQAFDENNNIVNIDWTQVNSWVDPEEYKYKRKEEYKSIEEQLDMQYWDKVNGTTTWQDHINEVKTNNPKPTE